jgi:hypothetical protein
VISLSGYKATYKLSEQCLISEKISGRKFSGREFLGRKIFRVNNLITYHGKLFPHELTEASDISYKIQAAVWEGTLNRRELSTTLFRGLAMVGLLYK